MSRNSADAKFRIGNCSSVRTGSGDEPVRSKFGDLAGAGDGLVVSQALCSHPGSVLTTTMQVDGFCRTSTVALTGRLRLWIATD